jgi:glyceraldehyde 3-phosphate dehydrogenase
MSKTRVAINGFGRIGRNAFKIAFDRDDVEVVALNDLTDTKTLAHLLAHDSSYGMYDHEVGHDDTGIIVDGTHIDVLAEKDPAVLPWRDKAVDVVVESTGLFVDPAKARAHIDAGAKKVVISAPAKGEGASTIVLGVNEDQIGASGEIISNASCTTNCITPVMAVLESQFGIDKAMMTTVHSYTASQRLQDAPAKDLREARAAAENIVPTTTGASIAAAKALPALENKFGGMSVRVPTPVVSLSDFVVLLKRDVTVDEVNQAFKDAAAKPFYQGILDVTEEELVSSDFRGNSHSAIVDLPLTNVVGGNMVKVVAWYDNEWGYSNRLVELVADVGRTLQHDAVVGGDSPVEDTPSESTQDESYVEEVHDTSHEQPHEFQGDESHDEVAQGDGAMGELDLHTSEEDVISEPTDSGAQSIAVTTPDNELPAQEKPLDIPDQLPEASDEQKAVHEERQSGQW